MNDTKSHPDETQFSDNSPPGNDSDDSTLGLKDSGQEAMRGYLPMPDEIRMELYEIEKTPPEQRGIRFGEYFNKSSEKELLQRNGVTDQYQTKIFDSKTGKFIIVRDDKKKMDE